MTKLDVILIHGIKDTYDEEKEYGKIIDGIMKELPIHVEVEFHPVNWNKVLARREKLMYEATKKEMFWDKLNHFATYVVADALAYRNPEITTLLNQTYSRVNAKNPKSKKIIIAHSQGTQIGLELCNTKHIDCLITAGSPILLYSLQDSGRKPIIGHFYNFWNKFDPICRKVSHDERFKDVVDIHVGHWNPWYMRPQKAHGVYFKSKVFFKTVADIFYKIANE